MRPDPAPDLGTVFGSGRARAAADLATLLREERALILDGAWARVEGLGARKAACLALLGGAQADDLAPLAGDLVRNQALLLAAIGGFRDARLRRAMLRSAHAGFATYDARGGRGQAIPARPTVERKA